MTKSTQKDINIHSKWAKILSCISSGWVLPQVRFLLKQLQREFLFSDFTVCFRTADKGLWVLVSVVVNKYTNLNQSAEKKNTTRMPPNNPTTVLGLFLQLEPMGST